MNKKTILITGGTGLLGRRFMELFSQKYHFNVLTRKQKVNTDNTSFFLWNFDTSEFDTAALDADVVINLAGEGIADQRWTEARKKSILESRVKSCNLLESNLEKINKKPELLINASAIGYYGDRGSEILTEHSSPGSGFLAETCMAWENAAYHLGNNFKRNAILRIGIVLSDKGGALPKMAMTRTLGVYNYFGNGAQYYSWIHIDDLCRMMDFIISSQHCSGIYNGVSPHAMKNKDFVKKLKSALGGNGILLPVPAFGLRVALGDMADVVLNSNNVSSSKIENSGFIFQHPELENAIRDLYTSRN